jgi:hypothetical protein
MSIRKRRLKPRGHLRGNRLQETALRELASTASWHEKEPLTWGSLATRLGVSRQALASKPAVVEAFHRAKGEIAALEGSSPQAIVRRTLDQRVADLEGQLSERNRQLNAWIEKWVTIEYNCRRYGLSPDKILEPLAKPNRTLA